MNKDFFELSRKEYKKLSHEFRNTFIGGRQYLIFDIFCSFTILGIILTFIYEVILDKPVTSGNVLLLIATLISYDRYFRYLKEYSENKKVRK